MIEQTELAVTVPDSVGYQVEVCFHHHGDQTAAEAAETAADSIYEGRTPPAVRCAVSENGQPVSMGERRGVGYTRDLTAGIAGMFEGEAGHTYLVTANVPHPTEALTKLTPHLEVHYDRVLAVRNLFQRQINPLVTTVAVVVGVVLISVGGLMIRHG